MIRTQTDLKNRFLFSNVCGLQLVYKLYNTPTNMYKDSKKSL